MLHKQLADSKRTGRRGLGCAACKLASNNQVDQRYVPLACWRDNLLQRHNNFFAPRIDHHAASAETDPPRGLHRVGVNFGLQYGVSFECRLTATMPALRIALRGPEVARRHMSQLESESARCPRYPCSADFSG
jgi:hypothetical protein